jgi:tagatose 1,6-diphosphate aldolase GatY/KbaY
MPYSTTKEMLGKAYKQNYAVCAFNAENLEMAQAIVWGAQEMNAPVIIQTTPSTVKYASCDYFYAIVHTAAKNATVPVALHLDHGNSFELVCRAVRDGYSSVMIDGSHFSFEDNILLTKKVVEVVRAVSIPVEADWGKIGGKEDDLEAESDGYTVPSDAVEFIKRTNIDSLAVAIGTAHGIYLKTPVLDLERLSQIKAVVDIPVVLHGATGLSDDTIKQCVNRGINKINFATELRIVYTTAVREKLNSDADIIDVKIYSDYARKRVMELVKEKIALSGSENKAGK